MKKGYTYIVLLLIATITSCGSKNEIHNQQEAIQFLESNIFNDPSATIKGKREGSGIQGNFGVSFQNGMATIGGVSQPYTIKYVKYGPYSNDPYYQIEMCGFDRYYGCLTGFLTEGINNEHGASLSIKSDYVSAYFSTISEGNIKPKNQ